MPHYIFHFSDPTFQKVDFQLDLKRSVVHDLMLHRFLEDIKNILEETNFVVSQVEVNTDEDKEEEAKKKELIKETIVFKIHGEMTGNDNEGNQYKVKLNEVASKSHVFKNEKELDDVIGVNVDASAREIIKMVLKRFRHDRKKQDA